MKEVWGRIQEGFCAVRLCQAVGQIDCAVQIVKESTALEEAKTKIRTPLINKAPATRNDKESSLKSIRAPFFFNYPAIPNPGNLSLIKL